MRTPYLRVLARAPLRRLVLGSFLSSLGDGLSVVAVPWLALRLGRDAGVADGVAVGLSAAAAYVSGLPLGLMVGAGSRRLDPRRVVLASCALRGSATLVAAGLAVGGVLELWGLVALLAASGVLQPVAIGSLRLLAAGLAGRDELPAVNALLSTEVSVAAWTLGPALGGLLTAAWGPEPVLALDGASFLPLGLTVLALGRGAGAAADPPAGPGDEAAQPAARTATGLAILRRHRSVVWLLVLALLIDLLYWPVDVALPIFVERVLGGAEALGTVWAGFGAGSIAGSLLAGLVGRASQRRLLVTSAAGWALALGCFAASSHIGPAAAAFAVGGLAWGPFNPVMYTMLQDRLAADEQQPVMTLWVALSVGVAPLGLAAAGPLVAALGARETLWLSAGTTLTLAALTALLVSRPRWRSREAAALSREG